MARSEKPLPYPATVSLPRPGDFPVGSLESRAAARALAADLDQARPREYIVFSGLDDEQPAIGECPQPKPDGTVVVIVHFPDGWTQEQWEQFLEQEPPGKQRLWEAFLARWSHPPDRGEKNA